MDKPMGTHTDAFSERAIRATGLLVLTVVASAILAQAQSTIQTRPDVRRAIGQRGIATSAGSPRKDGYSPLRTSVTLPSRPDSQVNRRNGMLPARVNVSTTSPAGAPNTPILAGTSLARVLHSSQ